MTAFLGVPARAVVAGTLLLAGTASRPEPRVICSAGSSTIMVFAEPEHFSLVVESVESPQVPQRPSVTHATLSIEGDRWSCEALGAADIDVFLDDSTDREGQLTVFAPEAFSVTVRRASGGQLAQAELDPQLGQATRLEW
jgi:hypothetical protein